MRERRRLALAKRQALLAQVERREALAALAEAVAEETRNANLAARSRDLLSSYGQRAGMPEASELRTKAAFVRSLQAIADQADQAHADARDHSHWQSRTLAAAQTRADRYADRLLEAKRELRSVLERREQPLAQRMARKLQNP